MNASVSTEHYTAFFYMSKMQKSSLLLDNIESWSRSKLYMKALHASAMEEDLLLNNGMRSEQRAVEK